LSALPKPQLFDPGPRPPVAALAPPSPGQTLTVGQAAVLSRVASRTITRWIDTGYLKGHRLPDSQHRRVHAADLLEFMLAYGMFRELAACIVADGGTLCRARVHDRWGSPVARVAPTDAADGAGADWLPGDEPRYTLKAASPEAFRALMDAGFRFEDGR
jgi:excisionase family DNA binding protein